MSDYIIAGDALARGLDDIFSNTWQRERQTVRSMLSPFVNFDIPHDVYEKLFGYYEEAPYPARREWGNATRFDGFRARNFTVVPYPYSIAVKWKDHDRKFDQLNNLENQAKRAGLNYATLEERLVFQALTATTDKDLLPTIPNAPDGAAIFSTTDGDSANRFGVSGGNAITPAGGVGSADAVRSDVYAGIEQFMQFQDPKGQPIWTPEYVRQRGFCLLHNSNNQQVIDEAFLQIRTADSNNVAVTNIFQDARIKINPISTPRITDNTLYLAIAGEAPAPLFFTRFQELEETVRTRETDPEAAIDHNEWVAYEEIVGFGSNLPVSIMSIN